MEAQACLAAMELAVPVLAALVLAPAPLAMPQGPGLQFGHQAHQAPQEELLASLT